MTTSTQSFFRLTPWQIVTAIAFAIVQFCVIVGYIRAEFSDFREQDVELLQRVAVSEAKIDNVYESLRRIEAKIDALPHRHEQ